MCDIHISFLQENYKAQNRHWEPWGSASACRRAVCVCVGGGFLSSTVPLRFTRFSFHLLSNVGEFYRCLANNTPFISPPVDIQINSDNGIFA